MIGNRLTFSLITISCPTGAGRIDAPLQLETAIIVWRLYPAPYPSPSPASLPSLTISCRPTLSPYPAFLPPHHPLLPYLPPPPPPPPPLSLLLLPLPSPLLELQNSGTSFQQKKHQLIWNLAYFVFHMSTSNVWFRTSDPNLCRSPDSSPVGSRQLSYRHSSRLCILSGTELLSPCPYPVYKTCINPGQDSESTYLTDATTTVEVTKPAAPPLLDTGGFDHLPLVWWDIISPP